MVAAMNRTGSFFSVIGMSPLLGLINQWTTENTLGLCSEKLPWLILAIVRHHPSWQTGLKESETVLR